MPRGRVVVDAWRGLISGAEGWWVEGAEPGETRGSSGCWRRGLV